VSDRTTAALAIATARSAAQMIVMQKRRMIQVSTSRFAAPANWYRAFAYSNGHKLPPSPGLVGTARLVKP
jgi:hypothetical protein